MKKLFISTMIALAACMPQKQPTPPPVPASFPVATVPNCPPAFTRFIKKSNPNLTTQQAERLASLIEKTAEENGVDPLLFVAIIRQESHFKSGQKSCYSVNGRRTCDYGLAQVNTFWVDEWELDAKRLKNDDEYNLAVGARILKGVLDRARGDRFAYSLYNTSTPELRVAYQERIEKYKALAKALKA